MVPSTPDKCHKSNRLIQERYKYPIFPPGFIRLGCLSGQVLERKRFALISLVTSRELVQEFRVFSLVLIFNSAMHKLGFSGLKSLDQFKSLSGSIPGTAKTFSVPGRPSSDSITLGSFANLKLTAGLKILVFSLFLLFSFCFFHGKF